MRQTGPLPACPTSDPEDGVSQTRRGLARCGALAVCAVLAAGPGATVAFADSHAHHRAPAAKPAKPAKPVTRHPAAKPAKPRHHHGNDALGFLVPNFQAPATDGCRDCFVATMPTAALVRAPAVAEPVTDVPSVVVEHQHKAAVEDLLRIVEPAPAPRVAAQQSRPIALALLPVAAAPVRLTSAPAQLSGVSRTASVRVSGTRAATAPAVSRPVGRVALPAQGPSRIGTSLASSEADVPIFVAFLGLLLVALGARKVGRFSRVAADEDPDLTWD
jgi:hypothetical protein